MLGVAEDWVESFTSIPFVRGEHSRVVVPLQYPYFFTFSRLIAAGNGDFSLQAEVVFVFAIEPKLA